MELAAACSCVNLMQSYTYRKFRYFKCFCCLSVPVLWPSVKALTLNQSLLLDFSDECFHMSFLFLLINCMLTLTLISYYSSWLSWAHTAAAATLWLNGAEGS